MYDKSYIYFYGDIMNIFFDICFCILIFSCTIRHITRTLSFIIDYRLKSKNWTLERFKH